MSGTTITIAGSNHPGLVTINSSLSFGALSTPGSVNSMIQSYLNSLATGLTGGLYDFSNQNLLDSSKDYAVAASIAASGTIEQFTNIDSAGGMTSGTGSFQASVGGNVTDLLVQTPGYVTLLGSASTTTAVFDAYSNVDYTVTDAAAGTMYLAGGDNSVTMYNTSSNTNETIYSAGQDTINLAGQGSANVSVYGNATLIDRDVNASVVAMGSATTNLYWESANSGGTLYFVNNSSVAATINIGNFNGTTSATHVTAYGGAGGGFYVGGAAGDNSLVGGTGAVTLVGAGAGDYLEAQSAQDNVLAQGLGNETLVASSTTGSNVFGAGLQYPGLGTPEVTGVISTDGSGTQQFLLGNLAAGETVYGSTQSGAINNYFVVSNSAESIGGGMINIWNFVNDKSTILLSNGNGGAGTASITGMGYDTNLKGYDIALSDGTNIVLRGLTLQEMGALHTVPAGAITAIVG